MKFRDRSFCATTCAAIAVTAAITAAITCAATQAQASPDLIADACVMGAVHAPPAAIVWTPSVAGFQQMNAQSAHQLGSYLPGLNCDELKSAKKAVTAISIGLSPVAAAMLGTGARAQIEAAVVALGVANPAVIGVEVIGATGVGIVYLLLQQSFEDCEKEDHEAFRQEIIDELNSKYAIRTAPDLQINYKKH